MGDLMGIVASLVQLGSGLAAEKKVDIGRVLFSPIP